MGMTEKEVLNKLNIDSFRQISKDKVIALASMLDRMNPEVAKKVIEQFPDFSRTMCSLVSDYKHIVNERLATNKESMKECYASCNYILETMRKELSNDNLSFGQRKEILESMIAVNKIVMDKDSENKGFILKIVGDAAVLAVVVGVIVLSAFGGKTRINLNKIK